MIGLCIDSNAQLPEEMRLRYGVEVVPLTVTIDGEEFLEGVDLDADGFYRRLASGSPAVTTAAPGPGRFAAAYAALAARGATEILSVHVGSAISGTFNAARVAAPGAPVPVRLVDSGAVSFAVSCCLWEAAEAIESGAGLEEAAVIAEAVGARCSYVFVVGALDLARAGGRLAASVSATDGAIPVLSMVGGQMGKLGECRTLAEAVELMAAAVTGTGTGVRVGVGTADAGGSVLSQSLADRLAAAPEVVDVVAYRIGPSVGVHTGPGTAGACFYPTR